MSKQVEKIISGLKSLGPGIITAALVFGPSKMTITSKLGALYGYSTLWLVVVAIFFMLVFTDMGARIGLSSQETLLSQIRKKWGRTVGVIIGMGVFLVTTSFQAGNSIGVGIAVAEATGTSSWVWVLVFNLVGMGLLFFRSFYKTLEKLMIALVGLMLLSFLTTVVLIKPDFSAISSGLVPNVPTGSEAILIAFVASCFSIVGAFYQSYLVQERNKSKGGKADKNTSITGIVLLGLMSAVVIICAAAVLYPQGIQVNSASEMSKALEPLFGSSAAYLFLAGLFGASFSSLIGNATVGGSLLGDAMGFGSGLSSGKVRGLIALVMVCGAGISLAFGKLPLELIIFAQSVTIFLVPFIGGAMYVVANDRETMGDRANTPFARVSGGIGLLLLIALASWNFKALFIN
ncbi:Nramp family divalent metal transporter [Algoriphagus sp. AGSA1]|uniref:Nramp family divalent metal transporter n=1 Tax=Algoriphagus sp. AGSA1 TaxID=2907213 RepID=UPI001F475911|nr:Nramp family divalent metal transporter [Algoriphagus sp. AGSA1]MCE7057696.1 Nramp family divalent metal transporter [Algoriphagus sp. AGSA1]